MNEPIQETPKKSLNPRFRLLLGVAIALLCLSIEGGIIGIFSFVGNIDTSDDLMNAAVFGAGYAYLIAIIIILVCTIILLIQNRSERNRLFKFVAIGAGVLMIFLWNIIGGIQYNILSAPPSADVLRLNSVAKIIGIHDTPIFSLDHKPLGVHVEYAVEIPSDVLVGATTDWVPFGIESSMYAGNYSTITNNLKVSPDASSTIFGTLSSDQSSTILTYESYDLFPAGLIVNSKNPNGDIDFCFNAASTDLSGLNSLFPATDTTSWWTIHTINDFYSMVLKNTVDNSTQIEVYVRSKVQKGSDLRFSTNNSYDVKSFYETVASGAPCNR